MAGIARVGKTGAPGVDSSRVLAMEHRHGMRSPLVARDLGQFLLRGRGMREEEGEADRWASVVSEGREWAAGLLA